MSMPLHQAFVSSHHAKGSPSFLFQIQQAAFTAGLLGRTTHELRYVTWESLVGVTSSRVGFQGGHFLLDGGRSNPTSIICDRPLLGIPLISHVQAHRAIWKRAECALLYVRALRSGTNIMSLTSSGSSPNSPPAVSSSLEPRKLWWTSTSILC